MNKPDHSYTIKGKKKPHKNHETLPPLICHSIFPFLLHYVAKEVSDPYLMLYLLNRTHSFRPINSAGCRSK
jgi:hypothetical protein